MVERAYTQIEIIGEAPNKRDYCYTALDGEVSESINTLLRTEALLQKSNLSREQLGTALIVHMKAWESIPDYYKARLSESTEI